MCQFVEILCPQCKRLINQELRFASPKRSDITSEKSHKGLQLNWHLGLFKCAPTHNALQV